MTANSPPLSTVSRFGSQQNPPVLVWSRTPYFTEKMANNLEFRMWMSLTAASQDNLGLQLQELTFFSCWVTPVAYCWHAGAPVPLKKGLKYTRFLHIASSLTPTGSSMPQALEHLDTSLTTNSQSAVELPKQKIILKLTELFSFFEPLFQRSISQSCSRANLFYCAEETHQSYWEKTVLWLGHKIW